MKKTSLTFKPLLMDRVRISWKHYCYDLLHTPSFVSRYSLRQWALQSQTSSRKRLSVWTTERILSNQNFPSECIAARWNLCQHFEKGLETWSGNQAHLSGQIGSITYLHVVRFNLSLFVLNRPSSVCWLFQTQSRLWMKRLANYS